jgi:hypothetical protein
MMQQAGFSDAAVVTETGFNSSPKTKGVLFFAAKEDLQTTTTSFASLRSENTISTMESNIQKEYREPEE